MVKVTETLGDASITTEFNSLEHYMVYQYASGSITLDQLTKYLEVVGLI